MAKRTYLELIQLIEDGIKKANDKIDSTSDAGEVIRLNTIIVQLEHERRLAEYNLTPDQLYTYKMQQFHALDAAAE
jgi:hypothetical protein